MPGLGNAASRARRGLWAALAALAAAPAFGEPPRSFGRSRVQIGLLAGYSVPFEFYHGHSQVEDSNFVPLLPTLGLRLTDPLGGDAWYRGNLEAVGEIPFLIQVDPKSGWAFGGTLLGRWNFLAWDRFVPFVEVGAGLLDLQFDLDRRSDGLNFTPQGGIGCHWRLGRRTALTGAWRYHHISNAGIRNPNVAIDSSLFLIGMTFFVP